MRDDANVDCDEGARSQETSGNMGPEHGGTIAAKSPNESTVLVAESTPVALSDPDEALRVAIKAAVDAGKFDRARALVALLEDSPKPAAVVDIATRRAKR